HRPEAKGHTSAPTSGTSTSLVAPADVAKTRRPVDPTHPRGPTMFYNLPDRKSGKAHQINTNQIAYVRIDRAGDDQVDFTIMFVGGMVLSIVVDNRDWDQFQKGLKSVKAATQGTKTPASAPQ